MQDLKLSVKPWPTIAAVLTVLAAPAFFVFGDLWSGLSLLGLGLLAAWYSDRGGCGGACSVPLPVGAPKDDRPPSLVRDLSLIALGIGVIRLMPLTAQLDTWSMIRFTLTLGAAATLPYLISRYVYRDRAILFPWRGGRRWAAWQWWWLAAVLVLAFVILPFYFISSGVYANWPDVNSGDLILRLFIGVSAVGIWDELFFICTVFALLRRHFPDWLANILQTVVFVSFLWELGYRAWGPALTITFALVQGYIFARTRSLSYVVIVHLLFDAVVFAVLVHAHNPHLFAFFLTAP